jgi:hypothetical protein
MRVTVEAPFERDFRNRFFLIGATLYLASDASSLPASPRPKPRSAEIAPILKEGSWPSPIESGMMGSKWAQPIGPSREKRPCKEDWDED